METPTTLNHSDYYRSTDNAQKYYGQYKECKLAGFSSGGPEYSHIFEKGKIYAPTQNGRPSNILSELKLETCAKKETRKKRKRRQT